MSDEEALTVVALQLILGSLTLWALHAAGLMG